jgi:hypothetical protein
MKKRKFRFCTPINDGPLHLGDLIVKFEVKPDDDIMITSVNYRQTLAAKKVADITFILQQHAPNLMEDLLNMAENVRAGRSIKMMEG